MSKLYTVPEVKLSYKSKQEASHKVSDSESAYKLLLQHFDPDTIELRESFKILLLSRSSKVLGIFNVSEGGITETTVDVKLILQAAVLSKSENIIICHNHPSGNINPSRQDDSLTNKIKEACKLMDIMLYDHLIICPKNYYSYTDEGKL